MCACVSDDRRKKKGAKAMKSVLSRAMMCEQ
uniref:Uncharacterized protein n=1 Tax=Anopheles minimus TaxID=112268 RepID=A0A182WPZ1_9DIPT